MLSINETDYGHDHYKYLVDEIRALTIRAEAKDKEIERLKAYLTPIQIKHYRGGGADNEIA